MKKLLSLVFILGMIACADENETTPEPVATGLLELGVTLEIETEDASGRAAAVDTDNFLVEIFNTSDLVNPVQSFDPFTSAPAQIELPTGAYIVTASSNDLVEAAFESPYYYGASSSFTIDKEETSTEEVTVALANSKVAINYAENVVNDFTAYTGQVTVVSSGTVLAYTQGETRPGYFQAGEDLLVAVSLSYTKQDGSTIDRTFSTTIEAALAKTQYNVNVDASLVDGQIAININVDDTVDEIDIDFGEPAGKVFLDDNGVTVKAAPDAQVGDTGEINGVTYTVVSEQQLRDMVANDEDVTQVCTSLITGMRFLFYNKTSFNQDIGSWDVSNVTDMHSVFSIASSFNQDISSWDVSNVIWTIAMFTNATSFNQDLSSWDVSNMTDMRSMFNGASSFNQNLSSWDVSSATNMGFMFKDASIFNQDLSSWDVSSVTYMGSMFFGASSFNQDLSNWDVDNVTICSNWSTYTFPTPTFTNCNPN